ncbi:MAG: hypothetical protein AABZ74_03780 [Cyanobacteriota bacterium]
MSLPPAGLPGLPPTLPPTGLPPVTTPPTGLPPIGNTTPPTGLPPIGTPPEGTGTGLPPNPPGTTSSGLGILDNFTQISTYVGSAAGGGIGAMKSVGNMNLITQGMKGTHLSNPDGTETEIGGGIGAKVKGMSAGIKELGGSAVTGAKYGAILGGAVSALSNAYGVLTGKQSTSEAVGKLTADTITATLSGAGGAVLGTATAGLIGMAGFSGLATMIPAVGLGMVGAVGITYLAQSTGMYDKIKTTVQNIFGK